MGMNDTPSSERMHIAFFGLRNAGKSSLVNAVTGQNMAIVSDVQGTTTDPVYKSMELLPMGPVVIIDTPGIDDEGNLGEMRVRKTKEVLTRTDVAVLVTDGSRERQPEEEALLALFREKAIPYVIAENKKDLVKTDFLPAEDRSVRTSAVTGEGIRELKERIAHIGQKEGPKEKPIAADLVQPLDPVVLVIPIDASAPKGRLILPQQQVIRDLLEAGAVPVCVKETELAGLLAKPEFKPALVITDSQAFRLVSEIVPEDIPLTSFSILMARYKGFLETAVQGAFAIDEVKPGDTILISEGCTHHRQCEDIGTVKLPKLLRKHLGFDVNIETSSGREFPENLSDYRLVIHCGGCMLNGREMQSRMNRAVSGGLPFTNYGIAIAYMRGILKRSIAMLPGIGDEE